ncbi:MAG: hypothetical protein QNJ14_08865 [Woeseiaceae bacterium]|nr:hypothetical protein [Woeseiaceae bacterium]
MKTSHQALLPLVALLAAACGGSGSTASTETTASAVASPPQLPQLPSNARIAAKAYDPAYSVPDGFFVDLRSDTPGSFTMHHVLDGSKSYELCTNDLVEAQEWEAADNAARAVNGQYVTSIETGRYFEFVRELDYTQDVGNVSSPTTPGFARVFKCEHTNRDGVDRNLPDGFAGIIDPAQLSQERLRDFTEYLWQFAWFNVSRKKVIESRPVTGSGTLRHTLVLALVNNQGTGACDRIDVVEWRFEASRATGEITRHFDLHHSFEATLEGGVARLCD